MILEKGWISSEFIVKSRKKNNTVISGYASVFGVRDAHDHIILKGAFKNLENNKVKLLWQHDATKPIGVITLLKEDEYGLRIDAEINNNTIAGYEASELLKQQALGGLSIGFTIKSSDYNTEGLKIIDDVKLSEVSVVTFPANEYAEIRYVKEDSGYSNIEPLSEENKLNELAKLVKQIENY